MTEEKKVEYLELIYDLIFVYIIGRNNSLLLHLEDGFVAGYINAGSSERGNSGGRVHRCRITAA